MKKTRCCTQRGEEAATCFLEIALSEEWRTKKLNWGVSVSFCGKGKENSGHCGNDNRCTFNSWEIRRRSCCFGDVWRRKPSSLKPRRSEKRRCLRRYYREKQKIINEEEKSSIKCALLLMLGCFLNLISTSLFLYSSAACSISIHSFFFFFSFFFHFSSSFLSVREVLSWLIFLLTCNYSMVTCQAFPSRGQAYLVMYLL